jgi:hypothetical protein
MIITKKWTQKVLKKLKGLGMNQSHKTLIKIKMICGKSKKYLKQGEYKAQRNL